MVINKGFEAKLADVVRWWEQAQAKHGSEKGKLYRENGESRFVQVEHTERLQSIDAELSTAASVALERLDTLLQSVDSELLKGSIEPLLSLTSTESEEAHNKRDFIEENSRSLPLPELSRQVDANALHGSTVDRMLYARYARVRLADEQRKLGNEVPSASMESFARALERLSATIPRPDTTSLRDERVKVSRLIARINAERYKVLEPAATEMVGRF